MASGLFSTQITLPALLLATIPIVPIPQYVSNNVSFFSLFEYDKNAQMTLDYNKKKKTITFDHLVPSRQTAEGKDVMAPDGSYDALVYKKDIWSYKEDVKAKNKKEKKSKK